MYCLCVDGFPDDLASEDLDLEFEDFVFCVDFEEELLPDLVDLAEELLPDFVDLEVLEVLPDFVEFVFVFDLAEELLPDFVDLEELVDLEVLEVLSDFVEFIFVFDFAEELLLDFAELPEFVEVFAEVSDFFSSSLDFLLFEDFFVFLDAEAEAEEPPASSADAFVPKKVKQQNAKAQKSNFSVG